jgi:hypothetical protein
MGTDHLILSTMPESPQVVKGFVMLEVILYRLIPEEVRKFDKLNHGVPYLFDRWNDLDGSLCLYYRVKARNGVKKNKKRLPVAEIRAALHQLETAGVFTRESYRRICPIAETDGPCGFAVLGRILEALHVAVYSGRNGFKLTDASKLANLLGAKPVSDNSS